MAEPQRGMIRKCRGPLEIIPGGSKSGYGSPVVSRGASEDSHSYSPLAPLREDIREAEPRLLFSCRLFAGYSRGLEFLGELCEETLRGP